MSNKITYSLQKPLKDFQRSLFQAMSNVLIEDPFMVYVSQLYTIDDGQYDILTFAMAHNINNIIGDNKARGVNETFYMVGPAQLLISSADCVLLRVCSTKRGNWAFLAIKLHCVQKKKKPLVFSA